MSDAREEWRRLVRASMRNIEAPGDDECWAPELERAPREQLRAIQSAKIAAAYRLLWENSPFYRRKFEAAGLGPDDVRSYDDLERVPPTLPAEWLADQEANPPWGTFSPLRQEDWLERGWMLFTTSGTKAAQPRVFRHTTFDRDLWAWHGARALYAMGVRRGDIALVCFAYGTSVAFWGLHYALNDMGVPIVSGAGASSERRSLFVDRFKPTILLTTPSYALVLGREMQAAGLDPAKSSVRLLVVAGEPGASVPATKQRLEDLWGARVNDDFGCTEVAMSPLGYTCRAQTERIDGPVEVHLMEDQYAVEVLAPDTMRRVAPGERGLLVVSNLFSEAQPILRYVMGDWITLATDTCRCGRTHARAVGGLLGRSDDALKIKGLKFLPAALEDAVRSQKSLGDEFMIEITREGDADCVTFTVEPRAGAAEDLAKLAAETKRSLRGLLGIDVKVHPVSYGTLPRTQAKAKRLFDRRGNR